MVEETIAKRIKLDDKQVDDGDKKSEDSKIEDAKVEEIAKSGCKQVDDGCNKAKDKNTEDVQVKVDDTELDRKIAHQINYYFSDVNLTRDKFMREQLEKNDNCIKLSILVTFSRLAQLTTDEDRIIKALKSFDSAYMELDAEKRQIKRRKPVPDQEFRKELDIRTVHISGFPDSTLFESLTKFCSQYGDVESLNMRRHFKSRQFKGCIHVTFRSEEDVKKLLDTKELLFKDRELKLESMEAYHKRKEEMLQKRKERKAAAKS